MDSSYCSRRHFLRANAFGLGSAALAYLLKNDGLLATPMMPPSPDTTIASARNCERMSCWRAPVAIGLEGASAYLAIAACLLAASCYGLAASFARRNLTGIPPLATATGSQLGAALGLAVPTIWLWPAQMPGLRAWAAIVAIAVLCTGIAYILFFRLIATAGPSRALAVTFITPVFAVLYGAVFLGERITPWMIGCALVIVCGTLLSTGLVGARRAAPAAAERA